MNIRHVKKNTGRQKNQPGNKCAIWDLRLYIAGQTLKAVTALKNLKLICENQLNGNYRIEVIDLLKQPQYAHDDNICAIPTLRRKSPLPVRSVIGDLSDTERVLTGLNIKVQNKI